MDEVTKQRNIHKATRLALKSGKNGKISKLLIPLCDITGLFWGKNLLLTVLNTNQIDIFLQLIGKMNEKELKRYCPPPMIIHAMYPNEPELASKLSAICGHEISPFLNALTKNDTKIFLQLLGKMNKEDVKKWSLTSIIFEAIEHKQYEIVLKLNQIYGHDIFAIFEENEVEAFLQLLEKINKTEVKKLCPPKMVINAMNRKKVKTAAQLMKICDYDDFDVLKTAIFFNETKAALMLIENGCAFTNGNESALILAIRERNTEVAKELINKKCHLDYIDSCGNCALVEAVRNHNYTIFSSLIENNCDIDFVCIYSLSQGLSFHVLVYNQYNCKFVNELYRLGCKTLLTKAPLTLISAVKLNAKIRARKVCEVLVSENPIYEDFPKELAPFLFREDTLKEVPCLRNSSNRKRKSECGDQERKKKRRKKKRKKKKRRVLDFGHVSDANVKSLESLKSLVSAHCKKRGLHQ